MNQPPCGQTGKSHLLQNGVAIEASQHRSICNRDMAASANAAGPSAKPPLYKFMLSGEVDLHVALRLYAFPVDL
jgi:hypothetical protein